MSTSYDVVAYRDGKWWVFEIPELTSPSLRGGHHRIVATVQTRAAAEISDEARRLVVLWLNVDEADVDIEMVSSLPDDVNADLARARELDAAGRAALEEATALRRRVVHQLRTSGRLSQADSATVLGVSRQRAQQLERTGAPNGDIVA
ncbi:MAG: hypothetical protein R2722_18600 [Tessaracoccus sp.]